MMRFYHCSEPDLFGQELTPGQALIAGLRCYCLSTSKSGTSDARVAATDASRAVSGTNNKLLTDKATEVGAYGKVLGNAAVDLEQNKGQLGGQSVTAGNASNIAVTNTTADPQVLKQALDSITALAGSTTQTVSNLASQTTETAKAAATANQQKLDDLIGEINTLATNQQSGGYSASAKWLVGIVLAVLALVGFTVAKRSK